MAEARIRIDQATNPRPIGVAGRSRDDIVISQIVTLHNQDDTGVRSWRWEITDRPTGSAAVLSSPVDAAPTFTPDVVGSYRIRLIVNDGRVGEVDTRIAAIRDSLGLRVPAADERAEANWLIGGTPNTKGWKPEFEHLRSAVATLDASVTDLEGDGVVLVRDIVFSDDDGLTIVDGNNTIAGLTWTGANIASRTNTAEIDNTGLVLEHVNGSSSQIAGADTAPRVTIPLSSLIPNYNPTRRYLFVVLYSWAVAPDAAGERFSFGSYGDASSPWPSSGLRFVGATAHYNSTAGDVTHEGERTNTIGNSQAPEQPVLVFGLDGPIASTVYQASGLPTSLAELLPISAQRAQDLTNAGNYNVINHPDNLFLLGLGATGTAAVHAVVVERLRVYQA